ncbi:peroxiredoxin [Qipengyuania soli]|uniref:peroxiredoxin n=1 Tax=Qipengyuania soli TaxID=2782568 RepID=UPI00191001BD|nr:peroxiredoxin [Qipengyuania soli]
MIDPITEHPLRIGETVPLFAARSTQGPIDLSTYRGKWVILFSHPADFTPVCTSEFIAIARASAQFRERDCALIGLSIDSLYSHLAWVRMIRDMTGLEVDFPIIEDPTMEIAGAYGMISADALDAGTVRSTFFIDPKGVLRATTCYPPTVGRSVPEMLRLLIALQRVDGGDVLAPADWQPGDELLVTPRETVSDVLKPKDASGWFFNKTQDRE